MIYIERTLEFKRNDVKIRRNDSKTEEPIILYKGDKNIELQFTIANNPFNYKSGVEITYGQLIIKRPNANPIFSDVAKFSNSKASFIITGEMIDDLNEIGEYDFQIRLLNADQTSRGTLPPVHAGIVIKEPVCEEEGVNFAAANYARTLSGDAEDTFDDEGNYNKTVWTKGDTITDTKLNKIEDAIYEINSDYVSDFDLDNKGYLTEHQDISYLASEQYVNDAISDIDIPTVPANVSELNNDAGYLTEHQDVSHLALKSEIPSIEGLATEQYVDEAINNIEIPEGGGNVDLSNYYTKTDMNGLLSGKADLSHNHDTIYYRKYLVDAKIDALSIGSYAKLEDLTTLANQLAPKNHTHEGYATETFVTDKIAEAQLDGGDVDLSNYYTKTDMDDILLAKANYSHAHDDRYYLKYQVDSRINALGIDGYARLEDLTTWANLLALKNHTHDEYLKDADFSNYATKDEFNELGAAVGRLEEMAASYVTDNQFDDAIGNINAILDAINGEEI